jgi:hypothetical protein
MAAAVLQCQDYGVPHPMIKQMMDDTAGRSQLQHRTTVVIQHDAKTPTVPMRYMQYMLTTPTLVFPRMQVKPSVFGHMTPSRHQCQHKQI